MLASCKFSMEDYRVETNTVIGKFTIIEPHIFLPDYYNDYAILDNGDTIPVSQMVEIGDTVQYKYFFK